MTTRLNKATSSHHSARRHSAPFALTWFLILSACGGGGSGGTGYNNTSNANGNGNLTTPTAIVTSKISGVIADQAGNPISGVAVSVFYHNYNTTVTTSTDAKGAYSVEGVATGNFTDHAIYAEKAGYSFIPLVHDPAGTVSKLDFNGLYRTVIRFLVTPGHDLPNTNFTALRAGDKVASLPRTGQTISYFSGDDFAKQKGVAWPSQRFTDNLDGSVTDKLSGLIWLKNAGCFSPSDWASALAAANQLANGACGLNDGSSAGKWRMPNANELESLLDISQANPAVSSGHPFTNISLTTAYWSSTTYMALSSNAMAIRFSDGRWINGVDGADGSFNNNKKTSTNALWAVKSGAAGMIQLLATGVYNSQGGGSFGSNDDAALELGARFPESRFIDKGDGTIADTVSGLTWLKQADCIKQSWSNSLTTINALASGQCGLSDGSSAGQWRLPNRSEMLSLSDRAPTFPQANYLVGQYQANNSVNGPVIFKNFIVSDYYWTSSTDAADVTQAWTIYSCDFGVYNIGKSELRYALAVR